MKLLLVADIGGTNARFGIASFTTGKAQLHQLKDFRCADYPSFEQLALHYLDCIDGEKPQHACLAIAGPVQQQQIFRVTNLPWSFDPQRLQDQLQLHSLHLLNDFAALAYSPPFLEQNDIFTLHAGKAITSEAMVILGPGTGFGAGALLPNADDWQVLPSESGHANLALIPQISALRKANAPVLYIEQLLSGSGLQYLYQLISGNDECPTPAAINQQAHDDPDSLSGQCLQLFCSQLGSVAGDLALIYGARGGVYIGGGIAPRILSLIEQSDLLGRFRDKGLMDDYLSDIPLHVITHPHAALIGAANRYYRQHTC